MDDDLVTGGMAAAAEGRWVDSVVAFEHALADHESAVGCFACTRVSLP